jgi:hypothetical protein
MSTPYHKHFAHEADLEHGFLASLSTPYNCPSMCMLHTTCYELPTTSMLHKTNLKHRLLAWLSSLRERGNQRRVEDLVQALLPNAWRQVAHKQLALRLQLLLLLGVLRRGDGDGSKSGSAQDTHQRLYIYKTAGIVEAAAHVLFACLSCSAFCARQGCRKSSSAQNKHRQAGMSDLCSCSYAVCMRLNRSAC